MEDNQELSNSQMLDPKELERRMIEEEVNKQYKE